MSRNYLLYVEGKMKSTYEDQIWAFFTRWCGHSQIFKIRCMDDEDFYGYFEMGCSGGITPQDTMGSLREQLKKLGLSEVKLKCWDMHQDKAIYPHEENDN